jgi:hypothetical protein
MPEPTQTARDLWAFLGEHTADCECVTCQDSRELIQDALDKARSAGIDEFLTRKAIERRIGGMRP